MTSLVERLQAAILDARDQMHGFEFADIALAADTIEAMQAVLRDVRAYNKGEGRFNFSALGNLDRENASYDAWQEIAKRIDAALERVS